MLEQTHIPTIDVGALAKDHRRSLSRINSVGVARVEQGILRQLQRQPLVGLSSLDSQWNDPVGERIESGYWSQKATALAVHTVRLRGLRIIEDLLIPRLGRHIRNGIHFGHNILP